MTPNYKQDEKQFIKILKEHFNSFKNKLDYFL